MEQKGTASGEKPDRSKSGSAKNSALRKTNSNSAKKGLSGKNQHENAEGADVGGANQEDDQAEEPAGRKDGDKLEVELTQEKLVRLQSIFEEADDDDDPGLDMEEFRVAMRRAMGPHLSDAEIDAIFMKVDSNCDGTVDWDEYLSYMLLECRGKDKMADEMSEKPFPQYPRKIKTSRYIRIHDVITKITYAPCVTKNTENLNFYRIIDEDSGKYITVTREGVVNLFNSNIHHVKQIKINSDNRQKFLGTMVTDSVVLPNLNLLAVATTACTITCYDLSGNKSAKEFDKRLVITDLEICATCLHYWSDRRDNMHNVFMWGDVRGNISAIVLSDAILFNPVLYGFKQKIPFADILKGRIPGAKGYKLNKIHNDFVKQIKYVSHLNGFLSACRDTKTGLYMADLEQRQHADHFHVQGGVFTFDYSRSNNVVVTGGKDGVVRVWNPYVKRKPVMSMQGFNCPIIEIRVNETLEQIISISELKEIRIYDLNTQACVQVIFSKWISLGSRSISATYFNEKRQCLILATNNIVVFEHKDDHNKYATLVSHAQPVTCVLYNSLFNQIVSGSADSLICVWNATTGERLIQFTAHTNEKAESMDKEITTMSFDPTMRRLITATRDGSINLWNFNNGGCLRSMESNFGEVTSILWTGQRIFTAGWSQRIFVYIDSKDDEENDYVTAWAEEHKDDILTVAQYEPGFLASGAYDGDIIIWSLETGHVTMQFNATKGTKPYSNRGGIEVQLGKAASADSMETLRSTSASSSTKSSSTQEEPDHVVKKLAILSGLKVKEPKSPRDYRRFLAPKNKDFDDEEDFTPPSAFQRARRRAVTEKTPHSLITSEKESVEVLLFLKKRHNEKGVASLLSAGTKGWVRAWSVHHDGGLVGQFNAAHDKGSVILTMVTDPDEKYLITGDSQGYIKVWYIENYCAVNEEILMQRRARFRSRAGGGNTLVGTSPLGLEQIDPELKKKFLFLRIDQILRIRAGSQVKHDPPPESTNPTKTHKTPLLLNSFRAHLQAITCMTYVPEDENILTGSVDKSVRCNTLTGRFIGICGQRPRWNEDPKAKAAASQSKRGRNAVDFDVPQFGKKAKPTSKILSQSIASLPLPADVRRVASATTLKVYYGGVRPMKNLAKNLVMFWMPKLKKTRASLPEKNAENEAGGGDFNDKLLEMVRTKDDEEPVFMKDFRLPKEFPDVQEGKGIFREKIEKPPHKIYLPKIAVHQNQLRVYASLPCQELEPIKPLEPPSSVVEITNRKTLMSSGTKAKSRLKKKPSRSLKSPADYYLNFRRSAIFENQPDREYDKTQNKFLNKRSSVSDSRDNRRMTPMDNDDQTRGKLKRISEARLAQVAH